MSTSVPPSEFTGGPAPAEPVCPRHPDRVSYVRCQRCDRPACPECQRQAAVGIQCVDCVREQHRTMRTARTVFGGSLQHAARPLVTYTIIGICLVVYVLELVPGTDLVYRFGFSPVVADSEPYRFLTAAFLHSSQITHVLFNMIVLWQIGPYLEAQLGRLRYAALYLVCALGSSVGVLVLADPTDPRSWGTLTVGASGAVFGLVGALFLVNRRLGASNGGLLVFVLINAVLGFVIPNVSWQGHLGGLVTGVVMGGLFALPAKSDAQRTAIQVAGTIGVLAVLLVLSLWKLSTALY